MNSAPLSHGVAEVKQVDYRKVAGLNPCLLQSACWHCVNIFPFLGSCEMGEFMLWITSSRKWQRLILSWSLFVSTAWDDFVSDSNEHDWEEEDGVCNMQIMFFILFFRSTNAVRLVKLLNVISTTRFKHAISLPFTVGAKFTPSNYFLVLHQLLRERSCSVAAKSFTVFGSLLPNYAGLAESSGLFKMSYWNSLLRIGGERVETRTKSWKRLKCTFCIHFFFWFTVKYTNRNSLKLILGMDLVIFLFLFFFKS